jgi:hypothetical protein
MNHVQNILYVQSSSVRSPDLCSLLLTNFSAISISFAGSVSERIRFCSQYR